MPGPRAKTCRLDREPIACGELKTADHGDLDPSGRSGRQLLASAISLPISRPER